MIDPVQLSEDYMAYKVRKSKSYSGPSQSNRCSVLGHPCLAYCYYDRTVAAEYRKTIDPHLAGIFDEGKDQERNFHRDLLEMGYQVSDNQGSMRWEKFNITGHRDFKISKDGNNWIRAEFKSVHPLLWIQLNKPEDVKFHKRYFIRKWYSQVVLYELLDNQEEYWLIMKNKSTGAIKIIKFVLDDTLLADAEQLIQKAAKINNLVQIGDLRIEDKLADEEICTGCEFLTVCNPPLDFGAGVDVLDEETAGELQQLAERREKLESSAKEYEDVDKELKERVKQLAGTDKETLVFGDWAAQVKRSPRAGFTVKPTTVTSVYPKRLVVEMPKVVSIEKEETVLERQLKQSIAKVKKGGK